VKCLPAILDSTSIGSSEGLRLTAIGACWTCVDGESGGEDEKDVFGLHGVGSMEVKCWWSGWLGWSWVPREDGDLVRVLNERRSRKSAISEWEENMQLRSCCLVVV
jgi:hypothetical protein